MTENAHIILLELDLGSNGGVVSFHSIGEIERWINDEVQFWQWLQKCTTYDPQTRPIWGQQAGPWSTVIDRVNRLKSNPNNQDRAEHLKAIQLSLTDWYQTGKTLHSSTPKAKRLLEYNADPPNQRDIVIAAYMLGYFINAPFNINLQRPGSIPAIIIALQEAILFSKGVTGVSSAELNALNELRETYAKLNDQFRNHIHENNELIERTKGDFDALSKSLSGQFASLFDSSKKTLEDITKTYDKKLALQSSVSYWTDKAIHHRNFSILFGSVFVLAIIAIGYLSFREIYPLLKDMSPDKAIPYWIVALILITAVVSIWIIRLIVRVLLSHIHLQRDSSERATMLLTYLALLREGSGLKEDEKKLILQSLFRPSVSGIIKDDGIPSGLYDIITKPK
jgi:hypothetical protein